MSVYIGNLPFKVTSEDLQKVFADYGTVANVKIPTDRETGRPRGFGRRRLFRLAPPSLWENR